MTDLQSRAGLPEDVPDDHPRGAAARSPRQMTLKGWWAILRRVWKNIGEDNLTLVSGGVSFFALLALFPALAAIVSVYGLMADAAEVGEHLRMLLGAVPQELLDLIAEQMRDLARGETAALSLSLLTSIMLSLWSSAKGFRMVMLALNIAYDEHDRRGLVRNYVDSLLFTAVALVLAVIVMLLLVGAPLALDWLQPAAWIEALLLALRWPLLCVLFMLVLSVLYMKGPYRADPKWRWTSVGAVVATLLWLGGSAAFTWYVTGSSKYADTYGPLGGVVIVLMWFYLTVFATLIGAELNTEIERQTAVDSTTGKPKPMGERGAVAADQSAALKNQR